MGCNEAVPVRHGDEHEELRAVLSSGIFARAPRLGRVLEYLCAQYFKGDSTHIKEYNIATEVLGRSPDFDQARDAIVRVEIHRLRKKLREYYETEGAWHVLELQISPGHYTPMFAVREVRPNNDEDSAPSEAMAASEEASSADEPIVGPVLPERRRISATLAINAAGVLLIAALALGWGLRHGSRTATLPPKAGGVIASAAMVGGAETRILSGFERDKYIDRQGNVWRADRYYSGGGVAKRPRQFFFRTDDPGLFETMRSGDFSYDIPLSPGIWELHLYFAETAYGPGTATGGGENSRVFSVFLNDKPLLSGFDIISDAGVNTADERVFKNVSPGRDGFLHLKFLGQRGYPIVSAIELVRGTPDRLNPVRIVAQETSYTDHAGAVWSADNYFAGGQFSTHGIVVRGTEDPDLYAGERYGNFSYAIPVDNGRYKVTLHFAETYWGTPAEPDSGAGKRVFDVYCNGVALLRSFDMFAETGSAQALVKTFHDLKPNAQGKLILTFVPVRNYASVSAIEVEDEGR